jgi:hypothetical protein
MFHYTRTQPRVEASNHQSSNRLDRYAPPVRPVFDLHRLYQKSSSREGPRWERSVLVDLSSTCQLDPPPSAAGTKGDKKLGFEKRELGFQDKKVKDFMF